MFDSAWGRAALEKLRSWRSTLFLRMAERYTQEEKTQTAGGIKPFDRRVAGVVRCGMVRHGGCVCLAGQACAGEGCCGVGRARQVIGCGPAEPREGGIHSAHSRHTDMGHLSGGAYTGQESVRQFPALRVGWWCGRAGGSGG